MRAAGGVDKRQLEVEMDSTLGNVPELSTISIAEPNRLLRTKCRNLVCLVLLVTLVVGSVSYTYGFVNGESVLPTTTPTTSQSATKRSQPAAAAASTATPRIAASTATPSIETSTATPIVASTATSDIPTRSPTFFGRQRRSSSPRKDQLKTQKAASKDPGKRHSSSNALSFSPSQGIDPTDVSQLSVQPSNAERPAVRAILHVGPHKIGSTSLQATLYQGRVTLAKDNFAVCPSRFPGGRWSQEKSGANVANCLLIERHWAGAGGGVVHEYQPKRGCSRCTH